MVIWQHSSVSNTYGFYLSKTRYMEKFEPFFLNFSRTIIFNRYNFSPFCAIVWLVSICLKRQLCDRFVTASQNHSEHNEQRPQRLSRMWLESLSLTWAEKFRSMYLALFSQTTLSKYYRNTKVFCVISSRRNLKVDRKSYQVFRTSICNALKVM